MRSQKIDFEGKRSEMTVLPSTEQPPDDAHLFCQIGFVDDSYFFRSYWTYGRRMTGGYGGWFQAGRYVPSGRILCFDDDAVYGYGRKPEYMVNASVIEYQLFAANKAVTPEDIVASAKRRTTMNQRRPDKNAASSDWRLRWFFPKEELTAARFQWLVDQPSVLRPGHVRCGRPVVRGRPARRGGRALRLPLSRRSRMSSLARTPGGSLRRRTGRPAVGGQQGRRQSDRPLRTRHDPRVRRHGGGRRASVSEHDRRTREVVHRFGMAALPSLDVAAARNQMGRARRSEYLLPLPEPKDADFDTVKGCKVFASELGYRLQANGKETSGLALKKLDEPITGTATFRTKIRAVPEAQGLLKNGFLAFGGSAKEADLVKCGVRLQPQKASIVQGPSTASRQPPAAVDAPEATGLEGCHSRPGRAEGHVRRRRCTPGSEVEISFDRHHPPWLPDGWSADRCGPDRDRAKGLSEEKQSRVATLLRPGRRLDDGCSS